MQIVHPQNTKKTAEKRAKKPWQIGKPWCTPYVPGKRVLWDSSKKGTYIKEKHGELAV